MKSATIIGAGISGLTCAWHLRRAGWEVRVLEEGACAGGAIRTVVEGAYRIEAGPNTLMLNDARIRQWITDLGLDDEVVVADARARNRFLARDGRFHPVPMSPGGLWKTPLLSGTAKRRLLAEPFIRRPHPAPDDESLADFVRRRLGPEVLDYMVQPVVSGIYAGDPERLSVPSAFPFLATLESEAGSLLRGMIGRKKNPNAIKRKLISFRSGLRALPDALAAALGPALQTGCRIEALERGGPDRWRVRYRQDGREQLQEGLLVLAVPAHALGALPWPGDQAGRLRTVTDIVHPPLVSVTCAFKKRDVPHPLDGFGGLIPAAENQPVLGVLFISTLFPGRCPDDEVLLTSFMGGRLCPGNAAGSDSERTARLAGVLKTYLGITAPPVHITHHAWPQSIPQPEIGHRERLRALDELEAAEPGLHFLGNYRSGVALGQCLLGGAALANKIGGTPAGTL